MLRDYLKYLPRKSEINTSLPATRREKAFVNHEFKSSVLPNTAGGTALQHLHPAQKAPGHRQESFEKFNAHLLHFQLQPSHFIRLCLSGRTYTEKGKYYT